MQIALVSREVYPYSGGGIAPIVTAAASLLSTIAEVTVLTSAAHRREHERLSALRDSRLVPESVRLIWVEQPEPDEVDAHFMSYMHAYSAAVDRALRVAYPDRGPDLIEFSDYLGEGLVTVQARHTRDPWLERTLVCVRLHTSAEICAVLDGHMPDEYETAAVHEAERYTLRHADRLLWPGGDVLRTYERFYGRDWLAPAERIADAFRGGAADHDDSALSPDPPQGTPLELLYLGRMERRKGVQNLVRALAGLDCANVRLTLLGSDTATAPLQTSLRAQLESMADGDERIRIVDPVPRDEVGLHIRAADVLVVPSLWECWPNVAREALMHNRPILATPVGGLTEMVIPGTSGWLARDTSPEAIAEAIEVLVEDPGAARRLSQAGGPRTRFGELTDPEALISGYRRLARDRPPSATRNGRADPLVSVVIPYFRLERHISETMESLLAQTYPRIEAVIVNDGSLRHEDAALYTQASSRVTVVTQPNTGLSAARNLGIAQARGRYILPLDADDVLEPTFVERCLGALQHDPDLAYAATWARYLDPSGRPLAGEHAGYMPYGNWSRLMERNNVGGTCTALFRRRVFELGFRYSPDLTSYEDWLLYYDLHRAGHHGAVIPEYLLGYRVRPDSMMRTYGKPHAGVIFGEIRAHVRENEVQWVASRR